MIRLVPISDELTAAWRRSPANLEELLGATLGAAAVSLNEILEPTLAYLASRPREVAWGCFLTVDDSARQVVGTCGYKGGPAADGTVEIAYFTFCPFEGQGYATAMASELRRRAGQRRVIAHTLPERNASCRVLEKAGFARAGDVIDPEDGAVWQWECVGVEVGR